MKSLLGHRPIRRGIAILLAVTGTACSTWRPATRSPVAFMAARPDRVRIVRVQRDTLLLQSPTIAGDTIVGYRQNGLDYDRTGVLMQDVVTIEVWRFDVGRTVGLVAGVAIGVVIFKFLEREIGPLSRCKVGEIFC